MMNDLQRAMLIIDRLNIRLPQGFEHRADSIARNLAKQLANVDISFNSNTDIADLTIPHFKVSAGETNTVIARRLANNIASEISVNTQGKNTSLAEHCTDIRTEANGAKSYVD